ncbi:MAG: tail fiber domain-containing protein [Deltaproteobacteria bacterium]|nr:tail fiber domain-containing protein [Deltaproteobacteria bacterium]
MKNQIGVVSWRQIMLFSVFLSCIALCQAALAEQVIISPDNVKAEVYQSSTAYVFGPSTGTHINLGQYCITGENNSQEAMAHCTVGGGWGNWAGRQCGTVAGGCTNEALGDCAVVAGGCGNEARGECAAVSGGKSNHADGDFSWAGGQYMQLTTAADHTFVWGYAEYNNPQEISTPNAFLIFPGGTAGKVGIGTSAPVEKLHIRERASDLGAAVLLDSTGGTGGRQYYVGSTLSSNIGGPGLFQIYDDTANQPRLNIDPSGNVGIGTTNPGGFKLAVNGTAAKVGGGVWSVYSDARLKDITGEYSRGLDAVLGLRPIMFRYKEDNPKGLPTDDEYIGFIAQEVQEVFPEAVSEGPDGYLDFNMHPVNVALVNAVKELKAENEALKSEIQQIKAVLGM